MNIETLKNNRAVRRGYYFACGILKRRALKAAAEKMLESFGRTFETQAQKQACIRDMVDTYARFGFAFDEYLLYDFPSKNKNQRLSFVADWEHLGYACTLNTPKNDSIFDDKAKTYQTFGKFYRRKLILFENEKQQNEFLRFVTEQKRLILKPLDASCGRGIQIVDATEHEDLQAWYSRLLEQYHGRFIAEELIVQKEAMAKLHPSSVNTVRVPTIRLDDQVLIVNPFLRVGQGGKHVDNGGAGGIICALDAQTGHTFAAADEMGHRFVTHPQTAQVLDDFQVPDWEDAKKLVRELAAVVPDNRYTGWDLALTQNGWVLVEANRRGQFIWQISSQQGFRAEINGILKKLGKKY